jgi:hypothetical protein
MTQKKIVPTLTSETSAELAKLGSMAAKVRYLTAQGFDRGDTSRILGIRYQWVRNVLIASGTKDTDSN